MQGVTTKEECLAGRNGKWPRSSRICVSRGPVGFYLKMNGDIVRARVSCVMSGKGEELPSVFLYCPVHICVCGIFLSRVIIPLSSKRSTYCRQSKDKASIDV
ncbi:hypothetical protein Naga_101663g1 [Nannochloropsis gaditana]|uniref:Uncharacterized protein n=1 Tax=Nannochloropsis gaditana TaxID=72520 RepID=W7TIR1_9STRA|nr:hypothetical protein Naga_101663g1 [Nannochloropsis gaditana]